MSKVLAFTDARRLVESYAGGLHPAGVETIELRQAGGRVLAEDIAADRDFPPFPRATRDGYAVAAVDVAQPPARLQVVGEVRAGIAPDAISLQWGQAVEIMTGAPVPTGADAVVMVEYTTRDQDVVQISRAVQPGENIVPAGAEARRGEILLCPGARLSPAAIALAASVGRPQVSTYRRPRIAIIATGDEIVDITASPGPAQIRNSNSYSLAAQVEAAGGQAVILPIAPDKPDQLMRLVQQGLTADLLLLSGGVSMGKYDLVEQVLTELGAEFFFTGALIQPGRPIVFGDCPRSAAEVMAEERHMPGAETHAPNGNRTVRTVRVPFFGLPGNPVSTMVCFELFARYLVEALAGTVGAKLVFSHARLKSAITTKTGLTRFLPALFTGEFEAVEVELVRWQGSGDMAATARANCYIVVPPDREHIGAGEMVPVLLR